MAIEDSQAGVAAALAAGMRCVAVATPFTKKTLPAGGSLNARWIVDDPTDLIEVVRAAHSTDQH